MEPFSPGQIYLADQRGLTENQIFRRQSIFNYDDYTESSRKPFGKLQVFNDQFLAAGQQMQIKVSEDCYLVIIPVTGELAYNNTITIDAGQVYAGMISANSIITLTNIYEGDWINFLHLQFMADEAVALSPGIAKVLEFDLNTRQNELVAIGAEEGEHTNGFPFALHIGQFAGRNEAVFITHNLQSNLFAFVIAGAFECQGRLLHERDGLALWNTVEADLEALSHNAVMLLIEM